MLSTPPPLRTALLLGSQNRFPEKNKLLQQKKAFFLVFLPRCLHRAVTKSIAFRRHNYTGWGCGCILNFLLIFFLSFYRLLAHLKYRSSQGKCKMPWFLVCRKELYAFGCEEGEFASLGMDYFFSSPVCMRFKGERKSLDSKVKFVFFKY